MTDDLFTNRRGTEDPHEYKIPVIVEEFPDMLREVEVIVRPTYPEAMRKAAYEVALAAALLRMMQRNLR